MEKFMRKIKFLKIFMTITSVVTISFLLNQATLAKGLNGPHKHDELELTVLKAEGQVVFNLVAPAKNIVGYEHAPKSQAEKTKALSAEKSLYEVNNLNILFSFSPKNSCLPFESYVNSDLLNIHSHTKGKKQSFINMISEKNHPKKPEDDVHVVGVGGHSDFVMSYVFDCEKVDTVTLGFTKQFPTIKKINLRKKNLEGKIIKSFSSATKAVIDFNKL
jgi:hypothetical protein